MTFKKHLVALARKLDNRLSEKSGKIRVLFLVSNEIGFINQAEIINAVADDSRFSIACCSDLDTEPEFADTNLSRIFERHRIARERARMQKWHYAFTSDVPNTWLRRDVIYTFLPHGSCIGNSDRSRGVYLFKELAPARTSLAFLTSLAEFDHVRQFCPEILENSDKAIFLTGQPKLMALTRSSEAWMLPPQFQPDRKTVLLSSHWTRHSVLRELGCGVVERIVTAAPDVNLIVTAHPQLWEIDEPSFNGSRFKRELEEVCLRYPQVRFVPTGSPGPLLLAADVLICDNSSIRIEFGFLEKPALFYNSPGFEFYSTVTRDLYLDSSFTFSRLEDLADCLSAAMRDGNRRSAENAFLRDYFIFDPAGAADRVVKILLDIGPIGSLHSARWRAAKELQAREQPLIERRLALFYEGLKSSRQGQT